MTDKKWMKESGFCLRLSQARLNSHMALVHAARSLDTSVSYISMVEQGQVCPSVERAAAFANLYNVSLDWLCGVEVNNND